MSRPAVPVSKTMNKRKVILYEDNIPRRAVLQRSLKDFGLDVETIESVDDLKNRAPAFEGGDVLICSGAGPSGAISRVLRMIKKSAPGLPVIFSFSRSSSEEALKLLREGTVSQIAGSYDPALLYSAVLNELHKAALLAEKESVRKALRWAKIELAAELRKATELEESYETTLENFMAALDLRDVETYGHSKTVSRYCHVLAQALGIKDPNALDNIRKGALLHDAGKIAIPDSVLKKPGPLTEGEWERVRRHPALGYGLVKDIKLIRETGNIILCHHEKFDGSGYPRRLAGEDIPLEARIFALADALDAITSHRPYRAPQDFGAARKEIIGNSGSHFDPRIVDAFLTLDTAVWEKIRFETTKILPPLGMAV
jgi:response regulator RpfG family c-di-GMP phosphodiesterase